MITKSSELVRRLTEYLDTEISHYDEIMDILKDTNSILDVDDKTQSNDILLMEGKRNTFKNLKTMILKLSLELDGVDNEALLTKEEKVIFYRLVRFIMFIRKIFKPFLFIYDKFMAYVFNRKK